jgi:hypothetical protein
VWLISDFPVEPGKFSACAQANENQQLRSNGFYYLSGPPVSPTSFTVSQQYLGVTRLIRLLYGLGAGIILLLLVMAISRFRPRSLPNYLYAAVAIILIFQGVFVAFYVRAIIHLPFAEQRITLQAKDVEVGRGYLYIFPLGINWMSQTDLGTSPAVVYENGVPLVSPNTKPKAIRDFGNGDYILSNGYLYFSSSDNTDPRTNGRKYELSWPRPIRPILQWVSYLFTFLGLVMVVFYKWLTRIIGTWLTKFKRDQFTR